MSLFTTHEIKLVEVRIQTLWHEYCKQSGKKYDSLPNKEPDPKIMEEHAQWVAIKDKMAMV